MSAEYRVTFGSQYAREPHPRWAGAHPDGWLTIIAKNEATARTVAVETLGIHWSNLEPADEIVDWLGFYPRGELHRIDSTLVCQWCDKTIPGPPVRDDEQVGWIGAGASTWCSRECRDAQSEHEIDAAGGAL